jgi:hypothetical protein
MPPGPPPTTTTSAVRHTFVSRADSLIVLPAVCVDLAVGADTGIAMPPAPIAKTAVPFIAVFLTNSLRVIPFLFSSDNFMAIAPYFMFFFFNISSMPGIA